MRRMEREAEDKLTAALQSLGKRIMANLSDVQTEALPAVILARIDDPKTWLPFRDVLIEFLKDAALAGADLGRRQVEQGVFGVRKAVSASFNVDWDLANTSAAQWAQQHGAMLVSGLAGTTRDRVASEVRYFVENGLPLSELRKRIMNIETGAFSGARAQTIAVTETTRAFAEGNVAAWQQSGVIMAYEWDTANDEITCPICGRLKGMRVPMGQGFGRYGRPPAHPNCRCGLLPVVEVPELEGLPQYVQWVGAEAGQAAQGVATTLAKASETFVFDIADDKMRAELEEAAQLIDGVHNLPPGAVPSIRVMSDPTYEGAYYRNQVTGDGDYISISPTAQRGLTLAHEYGHHLDAQWLIVNDNRWRGPFDRKDAVLTRFWDAVVESRQYKQLDDMYWGSSNPSPYLKYVFSGEELWARAYSQYVAVRSGNPALLRQLQELRRTPFMYQWDDDDFEPIADAIDALIASKVQ